MDKYHFWIKGQFFDENTKKELKSLSEKEDIKEIDDVLWDLSTGLYPADKEYDTTALTRLKTNAK